MHVYVFGLGYVGLPMAAWIVLKGNQVIGVDINPHHTEQIRQGTVSIHEHFNGVPLAQLVLDQLQSGELIIQNRFERLDDAPGIFVVSVGISLSRDGKPDMAPLQSVLDQILPHCIGEDLLLFRTTMIPGTCETLIAPQIKKTGIPIHLAYCPETIAETRAFEELSQNPLILAGLDEPSYQKAEQFLRSLSDAPVYKASNLRTAEMAKVIQNIDRDVNIALINEIGAAASKLDIDIYELRSLVNTHPRVELLQPGPGVGGYCLPNALGYLEQAFPNQEINLKLMRTARENNEQRPYQIVQTINNALLASGKKINGASIACVGLAMKDYCADCRHSPALTIIHELLTLGAQVKAYDPLVPLSYDFQTESFAECIKNADCLVITAKQQGITFDTNVLRSSMNKPLLVIDTRDIFPRADDIRVYSC